MLKYKKMTVGQMGTNCYLVWDENTKEAVIIDPGDEGVEIAQEINYLQLVLKYILLTHGHSDHWQGAKDLRMIFNAYIGLNYFDKFLYKGIIDVDLGKQVNIMGLEIFKTPGHTPGSVCFLDPINKWVFSGDLISTDGMDYGENRDYTNKKELDNSRNKILALDDNYLLLPGHGEEVLIGTLKY